MAVFTIKNLTFTYPARSKAALQNVNLTVNSGQFIVICGKSGSGKSTLLRQFKTALVPNGSIDGEIFFNGRPLRRVLQREQAQKIGFVMQNPDSQIVTDKVWHELVFGLESLGENKETIRLRAAEIAGFFGMQDWFDKNVNILSGGQKQILNLASVMMLQPQVLILDEPTSRLDPIAAGEFLETVKRINRELGTTIIMVEHRLEEVFAYADRIAVMDEGRIIINDIPQKAAEKLAKIGSRMFAAMPVPVRVYAELAEDSIGQNFACPLHIKDGRLWLSEIFDTATPQITQLPPNLASNTEKSGENKHEGKRYDSLRNINLNSRKPAVQLKNVWFRYEKDGHDIIKDFSLDIYSSEFFAVVGGNGAGKTTLLRLIIGINKAYRGKVKINEDSETAVRVALLPQDPQTVFVESTLRKDLMLTLDDIEREKRRSGSRKSEGALTATDKEAKLFEVARITDTEKLLDVHPYDLSGGEQQRAALAKLLLSNPDIILLDEPTKGIDNYFKQKLAGILKDLCKQGKTVIVVSHDTEFCAEYADRCAMIFNGRMMTCAAPREFFSGNGFYTTAANKMSRHIFKNAVTPRDIAELVRANMHNCEEDIKGTDEPPVAGYDLRADEKSAKTAEKQVIERVKVQDENENLAEISKLLKTLISSVMIMLTVAAAFAGIFFMNDRKYYTVSFVIVILAMIPFFLSFERKKPRTGEVMIVAVLTAIAVAGRAIFFMTPNFKPVSAIAIITGIYLGPQSGFLVGAMSGFVSDFFFGQGPWTPWQMCAFGMVGLFAGLFGKSGKIRTNRTAVTVLGTILTFFVYGGIVDLWTIFGFYEKPTFTAAAAVYTAAMPFNIIHAASSAVFLYFMLNPMKEKLERIKLKYGLGFAKETCL